LMFDRSVMHLKHLLRLRDEGFDKALSGGLQTFTFWVEENFFEKDDAELLLITGTGWITTMIASEAGLAAAVDRPFAEALIKRSVELDPELKGGNGLGLLGMVECAMPVAYGGRPNKGMQILERAAKVSNRQAHLVLINIAEYCAVALQDRKLFRKVLMEIIESGDVEKYRLENKLARRKAERLLSQIDDLFFEDA